jgi:hypothetical protein
MTVGIFESWALPFSPKIAKVAMDENALYRVIEKSDASKAVKSFLFGCHPSLLRT